MNLLSPAEIAQSCCDSGAAKAARRLRHTLMLAALAGFIIAMGAVFSNTAAHSGADVGAARLTSGALFAFGLPLVMLTGAELFTGNTLITVSALCRRVSAGKMLRNWLLVYAGNLAGALAVAAGCAFFGQFDYSGGQLAVYTIKIAAAKCAVPFAGGVVSGFFCNMLVCMGVLAGTAAKDAAGRILGAWLPVVIFVTAGFEHSVANMYYIPAGIFASSIPRYAQLAAAAGVDTSGLSAAGLAANLLPVTLGNILGGAALGCLAWACFLRPAGDKRP